jgi:hypothetical protein
MGPTALLPLRRKECWGFFRPKNQTNSAGCEPANLGTKGQHATSRPPKPLYLNIAVMERKKRFFFVVLTVNNVVNTKSAAMKNNVLYLLLRSSCRCQHCVKHLCHHLTCPIFLSDFKQIWILSTDLHKRHRYQISQKSIKWVPRWYMRTDGQTDGHDSPDRRFSWLFERAE